MVEIAMVSLMIERYGADVMRFCRRLACCIPDAEDLYQQTFLKLMELKVALVQEENPRAYLFALANGIWKNEYRKRRRRAMLAPSISLDDSPIEQVGQLDTQGEVLEKLCREELTAAVQRLDLKYRTPIILMYTFDMSIEEIAGIEHLPKGTVKSRLSRAREKLRREMEERGYGNAL